MVTMRRELGWSLLRPFDKKRSLVPSGPSGMTLSTPEAKQGLTTAALFASQLPFDVIIYGFSEVTLIPKDRISLVQNV